MRTITSRGSEQQRTAAQDRLRWVRPSLTRMSAGEAELGANPFTPEGIGFGS